MICAIRLVCFSTKHVISLLPIAFFITKTKGSVSRRFVRGVATLEFSNNLRILSLVLEGRYLREVVYYFDWLATLV